MKVGDACAMGFEVRELAQRDSLVVWKFSILGR